MSINKNDCMDCANSIKLNSIDNDKQWWLCSKGYIIPQNNDGIVEALDVECIAFDYQE